MVSRACPTRSPTRLRPTRPNMGRSTGRGITGSGSRTPSTRTRPRSYGRCTGATPVPNPHWSRIPPQQRAAVAVDVCTQDAEPAQLTGELPRNPGLLKPGADIRDRPVADERAHRSRARNHRARPASRASRRTRSGDAHGSPEPDECGRAQQGQFIGRDVKVEPQHRRGDEKNVLADKGKDEGTDQPR